MSLRINAYVLAADPAFLAASVASYLPIVDRVVVSFDRQHLSWSGMTVPVNECLRELSALTATGKLDLRPGDFSHPGLPPLECDTRQRQEALDAASEGADWVLQFDSDEVLPNVGLFHRLLSQAHEAGREGLAYPSRWLYAEIGPGWYLEKSSRWWRAAAGYPGPLAVRAGATLTLARQTQGPLYRVDFRRRNTDPWHPRDVQVDQVVPVRDGVVHFSWVRTDYEMAMKARTSGHRDDLDWATQLRTWRWRSRHPLLASALNPFRSREKHGWLRPVRVGVDAVPRARDDVNA